MYVCITPFAAEQEAIRELVVATEPSLRAKGDYCYIYPCINLSIHLSVYIYPSMYPSICTYIYIPIYLSI